MRDQFGQLLFITPLGDQERVMTERTAHGRFDLRQLEGLRQIIERARAHRGNRVFDCLRAADHDDDRVGRKSQRTRHEF